MTAPFPDSILKWEEPIETTKDFKLKEYLDWSNPLARKKHPLPPLDKLPPLDEILNAIFPVRQFEFSGKKYLQFVSTEDTKREMLGALEAELIKKLKDRQAR
jgi:hypothetical protein